MGFRTLDICQAAEVHIKMGQIEISSSSGTVSVPVELNEGAKMVHRSTKQGDNNMKRFIIALLCVVCFSPQVMAKTHTIEVISEPISVEYAKERNSANEVIYDVQEKLAYKNAQMKVSEQLGIVVESLTKTRNMAIIKILIDKSFQ